MNADRFPRQAGPPVALVLLVAALTVVVRAHLGLSPTALAASPERTAEGKLWLLVTSGLLVDHPVVISLVAFAALAALAFAFCGARVFWIAALLGHVASTLLVYLLVALTRLAEPQAFAGALRSPDYGVSAISAAWLGAVAATSWRQRSRTPAGRAAIVLGCAAVGLFAYSLRPDVTILSSEHLVAFGLGIAVAAPLPIAALRRRLLSIRFRLPAGADPITLGAVGLAGVIAAIGIAPSALADLKEQLLQTSHPSAAKCVSNWNASAGALRGELAHGVELAFVTTDREQFVLRAHRLKWVDYCSFAFYRSGAQLVAVEAVWRNGHASRWRVTRLTHAPPPAPANVALEPGGLLRVVRAPEAS
jgi:hypothetical protein